MQQWTADDTRKQDEFVAVARHYQAEACDGADSSVRRLRSELASTEQSFNALTDRIRIVGRTPRLLGRIGKRRNRIIQLRGQIETLTRDIAPLQIITAELLRDQYRRMRNIPRVKDVFMARQTLVALTDALYGKDSHGKWHRVGQLRIMMDLVNLHTGFTWENLDGAVEGLQAPPNIFSNGQVGCMGTAQKPLSSATHRRDYVEALSISVRYPECTGNSDKISLWPQVEIEEVPEWYIITFGL